MENRFVYLTIDPVEFRQRIQNQIKLVQDLGLNAVVYSLGESDKVYDDSRFSFETQRIRISISKGPLRYLLFNLLAFLKLMFNPCSVLHFRSIWVIPAVLFYRLFHKCILIYDANEFFAGHKLFDESRRRKWFWLSFEKLLIPYLDVLLTVSEPLAGFYRKRYPSLKKIEVIRNLPSISVTKNLHLGDQKRSSDIVRLGFHGFFLPGRALYQIIEAISHLNDLPIETTFIGDGILKSDMVRKIEEYHLENRIQILPFVNNDELIPLISKSDIGLSIIEPDCINRTYALPNKFFEFIMARVPVLASNIPTLQTYIEKYQVGRTVDPYNIEDISRTLREMVTNNKQRLSWRDNCATAALDLSWETESKLLQDLYRKLLS